jgi:Glycosyl hydrolase family 26
MIGVMVEAAAAPDTHASARWQDDLARLAVPAALDTGGPTTRIFGLSAAGPHRGLDDALALSSELGRHLDLLNFYLNWPESFPTASLDAIDSAGATPEITWQPWVSEADGTHQGIALRAIAAGDYDSFLRRWAVSAARWKQPLLLRFAHEMNTIGLPWSAQAPGNTPQGYVAAYRHVVNVFRAAGATNVQWIWSPNVSYDGSTPLAQVYPGRHYVDIVGVDGYNSGTQIAGSQWRSPAQLFGPTLAQVRQVAPKIPILITETASSASGGSKPAWIGELFGYMHAQPDVIGVVWFNIASRADWPLDDSPADLAAASAALSAY